MDWSDAEKSLSSGAGTLLKNIQGAQRSLDALYARQVKWNEAAALGAKSYGSYKKDIQALEHQIKMENASTAEQYAYLLTLQKRYKRLSTDEARDLSERLYDIREQLRSEQYQQDMNLYAHQKAMGELSVQQEIEALEKIKAAHRLTNEELCDMDERLYALRQSLQSDALEKQRDSVTGLYDTVLSALENRYEKERAAEKDALNARLAELDAQRDAEDEARKKQEYADNLAELERALRVEKSARKRREIEQRISDAILQEQERQLDLERQAQKDEVSAALERVDQKYDALVGAESLRQETLKTLLSGNLDQMAALIEQNAPRFLDAGALLADCLTEGLTGDKTGLLSALTAAFDGIAQRARGNIEQLAGAAVGTLGQGAVNEASDADAVLETIGEAVRSAQRG